MAKITAPLAFVLTSSSVLGFFSRERAAHAAKHIGNSFLVTDEESLTKAPGAWLVRIYNEATPEKPVKKFRDSATAAGRVFPLLPSLAEVPEGEAAAEENAKPVEITKGSLKLLKDLWADRDNWSGTPLFGGNTDGSKEAEGHLTHLKKLGLVDTFMDDGCSWVAFKVDVDALTFKVVKESKKAEPAAKPAAAAKKPATSGAGKAPQFAGKKVKLTKVGMEAKRREDTRRTASWLALKDGMTWEEAVKAGARPADLDKMYRLGHIQWK